MKKIISFFIFIFLIIPHFDFALDPQKKITQYIHDVWGIEQGLPQVCVYAIIQAREDYLWLGTAEGLARFDGVDFDVFDKRSVKQMSHNLIRALYEDREGNLWIGTLGGLTCLNMKNRKFTQYTTKQGLANDTVFTICEDRQGSLWIGTDGGGLNCLKDGKFTTYTTLEGLASNVVRAICEDQDGSLWIGTEGGGLNCLKHDKFTTKFTTYTTREGLASNVVRAICEDQDGSLWIGTEKGLNRLKDGKFSTYTTQQGLSNDRIRCICEDRDGSLWIGTWGGGLNRLNPKDGKLTTYTSREGLSHDMIFTIHEDQEGNLWIGTYGGGLNCLKDGKFTTYSTWEGLSNNTIKPIYEDREGGLWFGTEKGLNRLKDGKLSVYTTQQGLSDNIIWSIYEDREGNLWIGTERGGLNRLKDGKFTTYTNGNLSNHRIRCIYEDRNGSLWIGTDGGGLRRLKDGKFSVYTTQQGLSNDRLRCIYEEREGSLWIGTWGGGLCRLDHPGSTNPQFTTYTTKEGLSDNMVNCIYEDQEGNLWIGTYNGGLNRLKDGKFTCITFKDGLFDDVVYVILEDDKENFWMTCNKGIYRTSKKELDDFCDGKRRTVHCVSFSEKDGMKSRECNGSFQMAGWKTHDGKLWFPTIKGVVMIDPNNIKINHLAPPVKIEAIIVDNEKIHPPFSSNREKLIFSPGKERFEIHYTGLSFLDPSKVRFKYKLEGFDTKWNDVGTRRVAYYPKIPPGTYSFRVTACNNDGIWNETGASFSFYLKPFFYQTWWFYLICGLVMTFLAFNVYRMRVKQLKRHKGELERLVKDRTNQLAHSKRQLEVSNKKLVEANKELEKLSIVASETDNGIIIMDAQGNIEWVNEGFTRLYKYTLEQFIYEKGKNITDFSSEPDIKEIINRCRTHKESITYEAQNEARSGKKIWTQTTLTPIMDYDGNVNKIIAIDSDITELKESEEKLKKANEMARKERLAAERANQSKSEFLACMSHEFRTPMNGVIGFTEMLLDTELTDEQSEYVRTISKSGEALIILLNDILDLSKIEAGEFTLDPIDFDPEVTIFDVCKLIQPRIGKKPIELFCRIGHNVPAYVRSDVGRFRQVLANLMGNAVKFTEEGEIELSLDVEEEEKEKLKLHVKVRDTGIGISEDKLDTVFEVFQQADGSTTRKYGGTGLGLSICKKISNLMRGDVWVESKEGKGSTFHYVCWVEKSERELEKEFIYDCLDGKKALIVDDNPTNLEILSHTLHLAKIQVVEVLQAKEVIPVIQRHFKNKTPIDICIIDIQMPEFSGYDLAKEIRKLNPPMSDLPLLAFSASTMKHGQKLKESGFDGFLPKPIQRKKLLKMVERLLGKGEIIEEEVKNVAMVTQYTIAEEAKHSIHILLVEDNPINIKLARDMLGKAGYQVTVAKNGEEAVEIFALEPYQFDLILMDIQMPVMDGKKATRILRSKGFKNIPIVAMTAEAMKGDRERCLEAGMDDYIAKPIKRDVVFKIVKKWCLD